MTSILVSFIIPAYNAANSICSCIDSIVNQPYKNIEIIVVNDGSSDSTIDICYKYINKNIIFRLFNKVNGGVSSARNLGLDQATGDYIMFIDADDYLLPNTITLELISKNVDMIQIPRNGGSRFKEYKNDIIINEQKKAQKFVNNNYNHECWGKIIKRTIIGDIRFKEGLRVGEDFLFMLGVYGRLNSVYYVRKGKGGYSYNVNGNSVMSVLKEDTDFGVLQQALIPYLKKRNSIAWHFMTNHLYLSSRTGNITSLIKGISMFDIICSPICNTSKKEYLVYKLRLLSGLPVIKR